MMILMIPIFLTVIMMIFIVKIKTKLIPSDHLNPTCCSSKCFGASAVRSLSAIDALRVVPLLLNINIWVYFV